MRKMERGLRMMFGSDPFAGTITERPIGITPGGGSPWRPSLGCRTRVKLPGGSLPITSRTSWPSFLSAAACSSACSTTAPQNDHEYGTTIPTFMAHNYARPATFWRVMSRLAPLALIALLAAGCGDKDKSSSPSTTTTGPDDPRPRARSRRAERNDPDPGAALEQGGTGSCSGSATSIRCSSGSLARYVPNQVTGEVGQGRPGRGRSTASGPGGTRSSGSS